MLVYITGTLLSIIFASIANKNAFENKKSRNLFLFFSFLPLFLISALRYYVGTDYASYIEIKIPTVLEQLTFFDWIRHDTLFILLTRLSVYILGNEHFVIVIISFIFHYFIYKSIYKYSSNVSFSILLFLITCTFSFSLNIMRQMLAASFFFYSIQYIINKNKRKFFILITLALLFHRTAILFFPLYFLLNKTYSTKRQIIIIIISFFLIGIIKKMLYLIAPYTIEFGIGHYIGSFMDVGETNYRFLIPLLFAFCFDKYKQSDNNVLSNLLFFSVVITILSPSLPLSSRIVAMFFPILIFYLPNILIQYKFKHILQLLFIFYFFWLFYKIILNDNVGQTLPYRTIFTTEHIDKSNYFNIDYYRD